MKTCPRVCWNCKYWKLLNADTGECHRYPPQIVVLDVNEIDAFFPLCSSWDYCAEWAILTAIMESKIRPINYDLPAPAYQIVTGEKPVSGGL